MAPVRGRLPEVLVKDALRSLAKRRPVVGNNKEDTSAIFYFFAIAAAARDLGADFSKGLDLGSRSNPEGRGHFLRHFRIYHQIGRSQCFISELGDIHGSDKSSDQVARANFLSTFLEKGAKVGSSGLDYPSRPKDAFLIKGGVQISESRYGVRLLPQWKASMARILSFRQTATPWHSLAIVLSRKYEFDAHGDITDMLILRLGDLLAQDLAQALYYYKQAAAVGDRAAQFNLGFMHANAQGTEQNYELALQYYRSAAGHGLVLALTNQADPQDPV